MDKKPEEKKYQYCILNRGGIKGLLPCSLRYMNGLAYLYYDISSKQNVAQLHGSRSITREWVTDLLWGMRQIQTELERFLLDSKNILWFPEQIFQELETNAFSFLYVPYYEGESGILKLMQFLIDHIDYGDEALVQCVYRMYEQLEQNGEIYLQAKIYEDAKCLEQSGDAVWEADERAENALENRREPESVEIPAPERVFESPAEKAVDRRIEKSVGKAADKKVERPIEKSADRRAERPVEGPVERKAERPAERSAERLAERRIERPIDKTTDKRAEKKEAAQTGIMKARMAKTVEIKSGENRGAEEKEQNREADKGERRGILGIFEGKKKRGREQREEYLQAMQEEMAYHAVAEESYYEEECAEEEEVYGRTVFIEEKPEAAEYLHRLFDADGRLLATLDKSVFCIGKRKEEVDLVLENPSVSRLHARIIQEKTGVYLEDINSTNGTCKNGLRLQPYEKRKLEEGDEIKCGTVAMTFR